MKDLNMVALVGRIVRDVETPQGSGPARFAIAVSCPRKQGETFVDEPSFIDCEYWHRSVLPFLTKGKQVSIAGTLKQDRWEKDGQKHSRLIVVAQDLQLLGSKEGAQEGKPAAAAGPSVDDFPDDIPF